MENNDYERQWQEAFKGAEISPAGSVWSSVELALEKASGLTLKRRIRYYKLMAAASLIISLGLGALYFIDDAQPQSSSQNINAVAQAESITSNESIENTGPKEEQPVAKSNTGQSNESRKALENGVYESRVTRQTQPTTVDQGTMQTAGLPDERVLVPINAQENLDALNYPKAISVATLHNVPVPEVSFDFNRSNADPGMVLLAKLRDEERKYQDQKKISSEKLWSSVGFGAGTFNPNAPQTTTFAQASLTSGAATTTSNNPTAGSSYSIGVQVGGKVSERIILLGGISYLTQNASYTSSVASTDASAKRATLNDQAFTNYYTAVATSPYSVASNLQYVSLPFQAGYLLINEKFGLQVNGGISTDFFMQNTLTPDNDSIDPYSQGPGNDSPYRPVTFSGLAGTELSYRVAEHYRIALNPGIRYSLNSIYKSDAVYSVEPLTIDVALRFRYIFR
jgi:hypothetical protein